MSMFDERQRVADHWVKRLREPNPTLGWSGDDALVLAYHNITSQWELWRHEPVRNDPDRHVLIAKGPVGQEINEQAIVLLQMKLVEQDTHRAGNSPEEQLERVLKENDRVDAARTQAAADALADPLAKFYHEAGKTLGVTKTDFYT